MVLDRHEQQQRPYGYAPGFRGVLLVYGEERANAALIGELEQDGYQVQRASHPRTLAERCEPGQVDLVIFGMAPARGLEMLRALRADALAPGAGSLPVLWMSTSSETTTSLLRAFYAGADDVTRHPLGYAELLARVSALMRRRHSLINGAAVLSHGLLTVDTLACTATFAGVPVELRPREFALLVHLAREPTRVHEKQEILRAVWSYQCPGRTRTVDSHASRLRRTPARRCRRERVGVRGLRHRLPPRANRACGARHPKAQPGKEPHAMRTRARSRLNAATAAKDRLVALGFAVIEAREQKGMSARELADASGIPLRSLERIEAGEPDLDADATTDKTAPAPDLIAFGCMVRAARE